MSDIKAEDYKGFETFFHELQMRFKMHISVGMYIFLTNQLPLWGLLVFIFVDFSFIWYLDDYFFALLRASLSPDSTISLALSEGSSQMYKAGDVKKVLGSRINPEVLKIFVIGIVTSLVYLRIPRMLIQFKKRSEEELADRHIRGAQLVTPEELNREIEKAGEVTDIRIGEIAIPKDLETYHTFVIGTTGAGKTALLSKIYQRLRDRGEKGIVYDLKGDMVSRFFNPATDFIFNPMDQRCCDWNIFSEIGSDKKTKTNADIDAIAQSLIPRAEKEDTAFFNDASRDVFSGILHYLWQQNKRTNADVWRAVSAPAKTIHAMLSSIEQGKAGLRHIEDASSKQALGVLSTMMQYTKAFYYLSAVNGNFSVTEWLRDENKKGWIFVVNSPQTKDTLRPVLSLLVDLVAREILSLPENPDRRIFMLLDEFGTLQRLPSLIDILTLARSKGGACYLGVQDFGRVKQLYGQDFTETIFNNCSTQVFFRVNAPHTAAELEKALGEREVTEAEESFSMGPEDLKDGKTISRKLRTEKVVLASEIMKLEKLNFFLKVAHYNPCKTKITFESGGEEFPVKHESLILRPDVILRTDIQDADVIPTEAEAEVKEVATTPVKAKSSPVEVKSIPKEPVNSFEDLSL